LLGLTNTGLAALVSRVLELPGPVRIVAIDGPGGAGKSTFAERLSAAAGGAPIVHTDDFASAADPTNWWPRLLEQVILPLAGNERGRYQRYDWPSETFAEWCTVDPSPIVIIEGVSAGRKEWLEHLSFVIWVETPRAVRLRRGIERDGHSAADDWDAWMSSEDRHYERDPTRQRADAIIDGTS
jgi:uridine kinase